MIAYYEDKNPICHSRRLHKLSIDFEYFKERYSKQILFDPIGEKGQKKLYESRVVLIGCGGLGTVLSNNMVRAGIGNLKIIDKDKVELSNLQRQVLFDEEDVNMKIPKALAAKKKLSKINSTVNIEAVVQEINNKNIGDFIKDVDLVLDGTDNFSTRLIINEHCVKNKIPWIYGAVAGSCGMVLNVIPDKKICFSCVFGDLPKDIPPLNCSTVGILNSAVNIVASIQSTEAFKILTGNEDALIDGLINIDIWNFDISILKIRKNIDNQCSVCNSF